MSDLSNKTLKGVFWSFVENIGTIGTSVFFGVILARLLSPEDFGLLGMTNVFVLFAQVFIDSGFSQALIQKDKCTEKDYNNVFWFNLGVSIIIYVIIYISSPYVGLFFKQNNLSLFIKVVSLGLIVSALTIVNQTKLTRRLEFKKQAKIGFLSVLFGGCLGVISAMSGFGVWSLAIRILTTQMIRMIGLIYIEKWKPSFYFSFGQLKHMFSFGSRILMVNSIAITFKNSFNVFIGKFYSSGTLGLYTQANIYSSLPADSLVAIVSRVSFPVFSTLQNSKEEMKQVAKNMMLFTMFITFSLFFLMLSVADSFFYFVLGEKWLPAVPFFRILCFAYMFLPMHIFNQNIMNASGRSDLFFRSEVIKYIVFVFLLTIGVLSNIYILVSVMAIQYFLGYFINAFFASSLINYSIKEQLLDVARPFFLGIFTGVTSFLVKLVWNEMSIASFLFQIFVGIASFAIGFIFFGKKYLYIIRNSYLK